MPKVIDAEAGVTRDPFWDKSQFASNFDQLSIYLDDKLLETKEVVSAYPERGEVFVLRYDDKGEVAMLQPNNPARVKHEGDVRIEGLAMNCGCSDPRSDYQVARWWEKKLLGTDL